MVLAGSERGGFVCTEKRLSDNEYENARADRKFVSARKELARQNKRKKFSFNNI